METKTEVKERVFVDWIKDCKEREINGLVVTFPGLGLTHIVKELVDEQEIVFITGRGSELGKTNIIYLDWINNLESIEVLDKYFLALKSDQIIIAVLDDPSFLDTERYRNSYASKRFYDQYWFGTRNRQETLELIESFVRDLNESEKEKIWEISGGIAQIAKHLALRTKSRNLDELVKDFGLQVICQPMIKVINRTSKKYLEKLGVWASGKVSSGLLNILVDQKSAALDIKIRPDLLVLEDGDSFGERLSRLERDILNKLIGNNGFVTKDQIAEIKWGSEEYSKFSDQAINKTMRRVDKRLHKYKIVTKWKTGYMLASRNDD